MKGELTRSGGLDGREEGGTQVGKESFCGLFRVTKKETESVVLYDLGTQQWDTPGLRQLLEKILSEATDLRTSHSVAYRGHSFS